MGTHRRLGSAPGLVLLLALAAGCSEEDGSTKSPDPVPSASQETPTTSTLLALGLDQIGQGDAAAARDTFRTVLALDPPNAYAHYNLGYLAQLEGDTATAVREYTAALDTDRAFAPALYNLAILTEEADIEAAISLYRRTIAAVPDDAGSHYRLGQALALIGADAESRSMLQRAFQLDPSLED